MMSSNNSLEAKWSVRFKNEDILKSMHDTYSNADGYSVEHLTEDSLAIRIDLNLRTVFAIQMLDDRLAAAEQYLGVKVLSRNVPEP